MQQQPSKADPDAGVTDKDVGKVGQVEHGIPPEALEEEPKGYPTSDRHHGETAPAKD